MPRHLIARERMASQSVTPVGTPPALPVHQLHRSQMTGLPAQSGHCTQ